MAGPSYEHLSSERVPGGVRLRGVERHAIAFDRSVTVEPRKHGQVALLDAGLDLNMPAQAARMLAEALLQAADASERGEPSDWVV